MALFPVHIWQSYRVERVIVIKIEAEDAESALDHQESAAAPDFDDPRWRTDWILTSEEVTLDDET